jgi:subtilisin family serine protease
MRRIALGAAITAGLVLASAQLSMQPGPPAPRLELIDGRPAAAGEVLLRFREGAGPADLGALSRVADADAVEAIGQAGARRLRSRSQSTRSLLARLAGHPALVYVEPNFIVSALVEPPDPLMPYLWGLQNTGQSVNGGAPGQPDADIDATDAWDAATGSDAHVVGVIDTGVDYTHPDLAANMWRAPAAFTVTIAGVPVACPAGTHGFNAIARTCNPMDDHDHGTHVAGTIGAVAGNGIGVAGINWTASIMGLKFLNASGSGTIADAINAIDFAVQARAAFAATGGADVRVLSNSWGGRDYSQALADEIAAAAGHDMLFVAAAGNDGLSNDIWPMYPASYDAPNIVSVAATTASDGRAWFSNYGAVSVDLGAPGMDILSTTIGGSYAFASGTSMATPHVSGAAALVLSRCALDTPALKAALLATVEPVAALAATTATGGRLNVDHALHSCLGPPSAPSGLTASAGDGVVALAWSGAIGATGFTIRRGTASGGPYSPLATGVTARQYTDTAVVNDTTYFYVVSAANPAGESGDSNEASATPKAPADLVVQALSVPAESGAGLTIAVSATTRNQGGGGSAPTMTRFVLSRNTLVDASDLPLEPAQAVPALAAGASSGVSTGLALPASAGVGLYFVIARADADGTEAESVETNNTMARSVTLGPDLVVSAFTVPSAAGAGGAVTVSDTVANRGGGQSGASTTRFYLSTNTALDAGDVPLEGGRAVAGLAPDATSSGASSVIIPAGTATGSYYMLAKADGDGAVAESLETNNVSARLLRVGGDLTISGLTVPSKAAAGAAITVTDTTTNSGAGSVGPSTTRFYLSANSLLDASDRPLAGGRAVPALAAGAGSTGSTSVTIPADVVVGGYYLIARADADGEALETQENNNTLARAVAVGPDLRVSSLTVTFTIVAGTAATASDTVQNQGGGAAGASTLRFYLSANASLDAGDVALEGARAVPALAGGASSAGTTAIVVPAGTSPGTYYVIAQADGGGAVAETSETNNVSARVVKVSAP